MTLDELREFEALIRTLIPGFEVRFKDESTTQKVLGFLLYPFNPAYMDRYATTLAPVVYFPSRAFYEGSPKSSMSVLAHELVHLLDSAKYPTLFRLSYLFPQVLSPLALVVYAAFARTHAWPLGLLLLGVGIAILCSRVSTAAFFVLALASLLASLILSSLFAGWTTLLLGLGVALLAPWPAPWRVHWEKRGYAMSLGIYRWTYGYGPQLLLDAVGKNFYGAAYYFMSWRKAEITSWVAATVDDAAWGVLAKEEPYGKVYGFMRDHGMIKLMSKEGAEFGFMRCSKDRSPLVPSGQEPHRLLCSQCGQNYLLMMQLVAVEPASRPLLPQETPALADRRP